MKKKNNVKPKYTNFDPNAMAMPGKIFGLPHNAKDAAIHLIGGPSAISVSGGKGAEDGPKGLFEASAQIELFNKSYPDKAWLPGIYMKPIDSDLEFNHEQGRKLFKAMIDLIESENKIRTYKKEIIGLSNRIDSICDSVNSDIRESVDASIRANKIVGYLGGCHGSVFGAIQAHAIHHKSFTILHLDAHHDLRNAYEGIKNSHASIMYNVMEQIPEVTKLVSVGIRSYGKDEFDYAKSNYKIKTFYSDDIFSETYLSTALNRIANECTGDVYISFDIDFLEPYLCPNTGTPVPGGFTMFQAKKLINMIAEKCKIIGFDLNEVVPNTPVDALVGAEILYHLCVRTMQSQGLYK